MQDGLLHRTKMSMRDIFEEIFDQQPPDPMQAARRGMRTPLRQRFYQSATVRQDGSAHAVLLDGKPIRTPARRPLAAPVRPLAERIADEWQSQSEVIDPAKMPLTRLANAIIDGVAMTPQPVHAEIGKYLASDLLFYRAAEPEGLVALQSQHWDPVLDWAHQEFGARFALTAGVMHVAQPDAALEAAAAAIPLGEDGGAAPWRLGAINVVTTLTGSALLALALAGGRLDAEAVWAAAHVDEDWNMTRWGRDEAALARRAFHFAEFEAAVTVLRLIC